MEQSSISDTAVVGCLLGTAMGDAIGLPYEGLSRRRAARLLGTPDRHRLLLRRGMVSDDTEHTCLVAQALIAAGGSHDVFIKRLAWGLRWWLLGLPAGVGLATLRACVRLWFGISARRSGVFSAGNGPAMRSAILGAAIVDRDELLKLVGLSTRITHSDPKAEHGAIAVALAARMARDSAPVDAARYLSELRAALPHDEAHELLDLLDEATDSAMALASTAAFAERMGQDKGVSGYVNHCVPVAIHAWMRFPDDFRRAITETVACGGDTDTTAAIVGGIVGSGVGKAGIPPEWIAGLVEWPRSVAWMERLAECLNRAMATGNSMRAPRLPLVPVLLRNALFLVVVLFHGLRRSLPPY